MTAGPCNDAAIVTGSVVFNATEFLQLYPQFTAQQAALAGNFALATTQLNNGCCSRVQDVTLRQTLLYLLTAHITKLLNGEGSTAATGQVGRLSDAGEGAVSATLEYEGNDNPSRAYYIQTQYGALYWQSTARWRRAKYIAPPPRNYSPYGYR